MNTDKPQRITSRDWETLIQKVPEDYSSFALERKKRAEDEEEGRGRERNL